jgi:chromosome segregation ATPase
LQETLSFKEHFRNAAVASGLNAEVGKLDKEIATINAQIDLRREAVSSSHIFTSEVKELQDIIDDQLKGMEEERGRNDKLMASLFENFKKQTPSLEKLPADQQKLAGALAARSAELNAAREQYLKASAADAAADTKEIETKVAQTQARLDARKRQLADAAAQDLTAQQRQEREFKIAQSRASLENAHKALDRADAAYTANYKAYRQAQNDAAAARDTLVRLNADQKQLDELESQKRDTIASATNLQRELARTIVPLPVRDDAVTVVKGEDPRWIYTVIAIVAVGGFFSLLMFLTAHSHHPPEGDQVPFAAAAYADEFSEPAPHYEGEEVPDALNGEPHPIASADGATRDDGRPLTV